MSLGLASNTAGASAADSLETSVASILDIGTATTTSSATSNNQTIETNINQSFEEPNNTEPRGNELSDQYAAKATNTINFGFASSATAASNAETSVASFESIGTSTTTLPATANNQTFGTTTSQTSGAINNVEFGVNNNTTPLRVGFTAIPTTSAANPQTSRIVPSATTGDRTRTSEASFQAIGSATTTPATVNNQTFGTTTSQTSGTINNFGFGVNNSNASMAFFEGATAKNQTFGTASNQPFGTTNNQNYGAPITSKPFGIGFGSMCATNTTQSLTFGIASSATACGGQSSSSQSFGGPATNLAAASNQTFGTSSNQAFGATNNQNFGGSTSATNTTNCQTFGGSINGSLAGQQFGSGWRPNHGNTYESPLHQKYFKYPTNNASKSAIDKLGTTNINVEAPIYITGYNGQIGLFGSNPSGLLDTGKLNTTNITVHEPITLTEQNGFGIPSKPSQPTFGQFGNNITPTSTKGTLSTTNITVIKPITITGPMNSFKFGINPTEAKNFGFFNAPSTVTSALEKLCTTNITVNKPISISGNFGRNCSCMHNCNCRLQ